MIRKVPGLNTSSMADISFLLLTFFLLTSYINSEQGIQVQLSPPLEEKEKPIPVNERNVLKVMVDANDQLLVNETPLYDIRELKNVVKKFITNTDNNPAMSIVKLKYIEEFGTEEPVSSGIVFLQCDRNTSYKTYIATQDQLMTAFEELRQEFALSKFGKNFDKLTKSQRKGIQKVIPLSISEIATYYQEEEK